MSEATCSYLADFVFIVHIIWIALLLISTLTNLLSSNEKLEKVHLAILTATVVSQSIFLGCPLTTLESAIRSKYNSSFSLTDGSFMVHYLNQWFGVKVSPAAITLMLLVVFMLSTVGFFWSEIVKVTKQEAEPKRG
ncbi:MAG: hypothetical protein BRC25_02600 [Parcubacteria group bacterium SW_6_46_9]|nr:MAG: hypothetical protein BRC25_02600 [Parcubacteria group bacterium SW_6_46_9]